VHFTCMDERVIAVGETSITTINGFRVSVLNDFMRQKRSVSSLACKGKEGPESSDLVDRKVSTTLLAWKPSREIHGASYALIQHGESSPLLIVL
jgi:hypothetical protein